MSAPASPTDVVPASYAKPAHLRSAAEIYAELGHSLLGEAEALRAIGDEAQAQRRVAQAADAFAEGLRERPDILELHRYRAQALEEQGDAPRALRHYLRAAGTGPPLDVEALDRARALLTPGLARTEIDAAGAWAEVYSVDELGQAERAALHRFMAQAAMLRGDPTSAIEHWREAVEREPHDVDSRERLAEVLRETGELEQAAALLRDGLDALDGGDAGDAARSRLTLGRVLLDLDDPAEARAVLEAAPRTGVDGLDGALEVEIARCALALGDPEEAIEHAQRAVEDATVTLESGVEADVVRAGALVALGRSVEAADAAGGALRLAPTHAGAMIVRAEALLDAGEDPGQAQHLLQLYLRQRGDDAHGHRLLVRALRDGDQAPEEIAAALEALASVAPTDERPGVWAELAVARLLQGDAEAALELLDDVADADAGLKDGRWHLARAAASAQLGEVSGARESYALAVAADAEDPAILRLYAAALSRNGAEVAAEEAWRVLVDQAPADGDAWMGLARALRAVGNRREALEAAAAAYLRVDDWGSEGDAFELRAELLDELGEPDSERAEALYEAGRRRSWQGEDRREEAFRLLWKARELRDDHAPTCWSLADLELAASVLPDPPYADEDRVRRGIEIWERGAEIQEPSGELRWALATRAWLEHQDSRITDQPAPLNWWRAVVFLERSLVGVRPPPLDCLLLLATSHRNLENQLVALRTLDQLEGDDAQAVDVLDERAAVLANIGRVAEAEEQIRLRRAQEEETSSWSTGILAWLRQHERRDAEAAELLQGLVEVEPRAYSYREMLAGVLQRLGRTDDAVREYRAVHDECLQFVADNPRSRAAVAGYMLFVLGAADDATLAAATATFEDLCDRLGSRIHEAPEYLLYLGLCRLAAGDLEQGAAHIEQMLAGARFRREIDDVIEGLGDLTAGPAARDQALRAVVERLELQATERRTALEDAQPTSDVELERTLAVVTDPSDWAAVGATASLARLEAAAGQWSAAAARYRVLLSDAADRFPEAAQAFGQLVDDLLAAGDEAMAGGDPDAALQRYGEALSICAEAQDDEARAAGLHARTALAEVELGRAPGRHLAQAARRYEALENVEDAYREVGLVGAALVRDAGHYWALDEQWSRVAAPADAADAITRVRAGLRAFLERRFHLAEDEEQRSSLPQMVTPIALEIGDGLVAEDTSEEWALFKDYIPQMREGIERDLGVRLPGVRVRGAPALEPGGYVAFVNDATVARGAVPLDRRWTSAARDRIAGAGIADDDVQDARDPRTGEPGAWLAEPAWEAARRAGLEVEHDPLEFVIHHLEAILRADIGEFVGPQEVDEILEAWELVDGCAELIDRVLADLTSRTRFGRVLRALLAEGVPVTSAREILGVVGAVGLADGGGPRLVAELRRTLRAQLPGNEPSRARRRLAPELDAPLHEAFEQGASGTTLNLRPQLAEAIVAAVAEWVAEPGLPPAVVTEPELRPLLRRALAGSLVEVPVLASDELLVAEPPVRAEVVDAGDAP